MVLVADVSSIANSNEINAKVALTEVFVRRVYLRPLRARALSISDQTFILFLAFAFPVYSLSGFHTVVVACGPLC
jgi:hypothetical protein